MNYFNILVAILIVIGFGSCAKWEQSQETTIGCTVLDPTTGLLGEKATIALVEVETPSKPFSPILRSTIEEFEVDFNESFSYEFNAKRGDRFEYVLEFKNSNGNYGSHSSSNGFFYNYVDQVAIEKAGNMAYELSIVPRARVTLYADNKSAQASANDSIRIELYDGKLLRVKRHVGIGGSTYATSDMPHGNYQLSYWIYRNGAMEDEVSYPLYLRHNLDTTISIEY